MAVGSGFKLSAKTRPNPFLYCFLAPDINGLWLKHYDSGLFAFVSCISARNEYKKAVCEENSQIQKTC